MTRETEKLTRAENALSDIYTAANVLEELSDLGHALFEADTMPSGKARRTIMRCVVFRLDDLARTVSDIKSMVEEGAREPEAEEGYQE